MGTLQEDVCTFTMISCEFFLELKMFHTKVVEEIETQILCPVIFLRISCLF
jgi:hypothetical protein